MLVRSKIFPQFTEKIEKPKQSLSNNTMLKIRSEMLKIRKNVKIIKFEKNSPKIFPRITRVPEIPKIFGIPRISREIILKFFVSGEVENPGKREILHASTA